MPILRHFTNLFCLSCLLCLNACLSQSRLIQGEMTARNEEDLKYYLYYPEGYDSNPGTKFGVLLFLHGGGESGMTLDAITNTGPPKMLVEGKQFPFLVLAPQNPHKKKWWNTQALMLLLEEVVQNNIQAVESGRLRSGLGVILGANVKVFKIMRLGVEFDASYDNFKQGIQE